MQKYKDEEYKGYKITLYYDPDPESPREWSQVAKLLSFDRNYVFDKHNYADMDDLLLELLEEYEHDLFDELWDKDLIYRDSHWYIDNEEVGQYIREALEEHVLILPISCYIHSGMTIWLGRPSDRWDSGYIGVAVQTKKDTIEMCGCRPEDWKDAAMKNMELEVKELDTYLRGNVYGYVITDENDEEIPDGSCWGYFDDEGADEAISDAQGIIDSHLRSLVMGDEKREPMLFTYEEMCGL